MPVLQHRPPGIPEGPAGDQGGRGEPGRYLPADSRKHDRGTLVKGGLGFEVLSDKGNKAAHFYGVAYRLPALVVANLNDRLDLDKYNGDTSKELPLSATYLIDPDGMIRYAFIDADYRKRAEPSAVVEALKGLKKIR